MIFYDFHYVNTCWDLFEVSKVDSILFSLVFLVFLFFLPFSLSCDMVFIALYGDNDKLACLEFTFNCISCCLLYCIVVYIVPYS